MKKLLLIFALMLISLASYSQTYKSPFLNKQKSEFETFKKVEKSNTEVDTQIKMEL